MASMRDDELYDVVVVGGGAAGVAAAAGAARAGARVLALERYGLRGREATLAALAGVPANREASHTPQAASLPIRIGGLPRQIDADDRPAFARAAAHANATLNHKPVRDDGGVIMALPGGEAWWMCIDVV